MNVTLFVALCPHCGERLPNARADHPAGDHFQTEARCGGCGMDWRFDLVATPLPLEWNAWHRKRGLVPVGESPIKGEPK